MAIGTEPMAAWTVGFGQVGDGAEQFFFGGQVGSATQRVTPGCGLAGRRRS